MPENALTVWFAPHYFYLHEPAFRAVAAELRRRGHHPVLAHLDGASGVDEADRFGPRFDPERGWTRVVISIRRTAATSAIAGAIGRVRAFAANRLRIRRALRRHRPDVVIVGSDLGGVYVRVLLDEARTCGIPRVVLFTTVIGWDGNVVPIAASRPTRLLLRLLGAWRAFSFAGGIPGTYDPDAVIGLAGDAGAARVIRAGVADRRIRRIGNPAEDAAATLTPQRHAEVAHRVRRALGVSQDSFLVVYCTEVLEELYGSDYVGTVNDYVRRATEAVGPDAVCLVKVHPRESTTMWDAFRKSFAGSRHVLVGNELETDDVIAASDITLAHVSGVLLQALMMRRPLAPLGFAGDPLRHIVPEGLEELEITSYDALVARLRDAASGQATRWTSLLDQWRAQHSAATSGNATALAADLIESVGSPTWKYA